MIIKLCHALFIFSFLIACGPNIKEPTEGIITITFKLNQVEGLEPSFQTAIWLENLQGENIKSLLVSEYLSYGGYNDSTICSNWSISANWDSVSDEIFDAVTTATPSLGENQIKIDLKNEKLPAGKYKYFIETHVVDQYNILYHGEIVIGGERDENTAKLESIPVKHPLEYNVLEKVKAEYQP